MSDEMFPELAQGDHGPHATYRERHGLGLKSFVVGDEDLVSWIAWPTRKIPAHLLTCQHAEHLAKQGDAAWGYTATEALAAYAHLHDLPTP